MFRALGTSPDETPLVMMGLDDENLNRLRDGYPIKVNLQNFVPGQTIGFPNIDVVIFYDTGEESKELEKMYIDRVNKEK